MNALPRVRSGLLRHDLDDQILVYDSRSDKVHLLDRTTARVMELLQEGGWTEAGMLIELQDSLGVSADSNLLFLAIESLREAGMLEDQPDELVGDVTRREIVRKIAIAGAASLLIPAITTLTATRGYAQTTATVATCGTCSATSQCIGTDTCVAGRCSVTGSTGGQAIGTTCTNNNQCCSGNCVGAPAKTCQP